MEKICPKHNKPLKRFEGISKKTGLPYGNWKCTAKVDEGWCDVIIWDENEQFTKKFTQLPNGQVLEEEAIWPTESSVEASNKPQNGPTTQEEPKSDIRALLTEINEKLDYLVARTPK